VNGGMTGWAQVHGLTGDTSIHGRARFDNNYIEHWSLWLDLVILVRTLTEPLTGIRKKH
jgi:lipopolysaccharide/colanic/teichoic acid biosynthesis glycosyltransferase